ncbi:MAG: GAF domain-containing protein [Colwellia sp.]
MVNKKEFYQELSSQIASLIQDETDLIANMANISALLYNRLPDVNWVGFYRVIDNGLVLGPFQGQVACIRIPFGKGVCGTSAQEGMTQRIANVHEFEGHIACDATSNAEIVIPVKLNGATIAVLDIDSTRFDRFDSEDQVALENIVEHLVKSLV